MNQYKTEIRLEVLMSLGIADAKLLDDPEFLRGFDTAIVKLCSKHLGPSERMAFFFAFGGDDSWDAIARRFEQQGRAIEIATVQRYAKTAARMVVFRGQREESFVREVEQLVWDCAEAIGGLPKEDEPALP